MARRHWGLVLLVLAGGVLRLLAMIGYSPAFWYPDSGRYIGASEQHKIDFQRPYGYSAFLTVFRLSVHRLSAVTLAQHLLGLALVVAVYAFCVHRGLPRWLAALAAAPLALDATVIAVEHYLLADSLFTVLLAAAFGLLLWRQPEPGTVAATAAGVLFAAAALTRTVGLPLGLLGLAYLLVRRVGWRRPVAFALAVALPLGGYALAYHQQHGAFATNQFGGHYLYGRVMTFADCDKFHPSSQDLCDSTPVDERKNPSHYVWDTDSPAGRYRNDPHADGRLQTFARQAITGQPGAYLGAVLGESVHFFLPGRWSSRVTQCPGTYAFPVPGQRCHPPFLARQGGFDGREDRSRDVHQNSAAARILHDYQRFGYTPGPLLALALLLVIAGLFRRGRVRWELALLGLTSLALLVGAVATSLFDYRYAIPALPLLLPAGALAFQHLRRKLPGDLPREATT